LVLSAASLPSGKGRKSGQPLHLADALSMVKAQVWITLQKLINKWMLAVTLHGLLTKYNTVKAIIQDWSDPNLEKAQSHIHK
jgi:hypothetical protein